MTCGVSASAPNATKNSPTSSDTTSTCSPWLTNITSPTLKRWRRRSGGSTPTSRSSARTSLGSRAATNTDPSAPNSATTPASAGSEMSEKTCHTSVVRNSKIMKISKTGTARVSSTSEAASCATTRRPAQRRIDSRPIPTIP